MSGARADRRRDEAGQRNPPMFAVDVEPCMGRLRIPRHVATLARSLHPEIKRKVRTALAEILDDSNAGKALKGELEGLRS